MREDAIDATKDVGQMPHALLHAAHALAAERQAAREVFLRREDAGGPVERVAAVIDGATGLGRIVYGAEVLPFRGAHLGAGLSGARWGFGEEGDDEVVGTLGEEAAELIEPERALDVLRGLGEDECGFPRYGGLVRRVGGFGVRVIESFEMFLELKRGVELV